jgi:hypothetical protein
VGEKVSTALVRKLTERGVLARQVGRLVEKTSPLQRVE